MSFILDCPACRKAVTATRDFIGRPMACPHCASHFTIPGEGLPATAIAKPPDNLSSSKPAIRFTFSCQRCQSILEARGDMSGSQGRCPTCGAVFVIPEVDPRTGLPVGQAVVPDDGQLPTPMHAYATAGVKAPKIVRRSSGEQAIICPRCDRDMPVDSNSCTSCGMPFTMEGAAAITASGSGASGMASAALTVGVLSVLAFCLPGLGLVAIGLGVSGLNKANAMGEKQSGRTMAIAGIVCGIMGLAVNLWFFMNS